MRPRVPRPRSSLAERAAEIRRLLRAPDGTDHLERIARAIVRLCEAAREEGARLTRVAAVLGMERRTLWRWCRVGRERPGLLRRCSVDEAYNILRGAPPKRRRHRDPLAVILGLLPFLDASQLRQVDQRTEELRRARGTEPRPDVPQAPANGRDRAHAFASSDLDLSR